MNFKTMRANDRQLKTLIIVGKEKQSKAEIINSLLENMQNLATNFAF